MTKYLIITAKSLLVLIIATLLLLAPCTTSYSMPFQMIPYEFDYYGEVGSGNNPELDDSDYDDDDNFGNVSLGFEVTIGGDDYNAFDMNSNGYVELLWGSQSPVDYEYGYIDDLIDDDDAATYLLAAYDDLSSDANGYFGYKLFSDRAIFYYETETYYDDDDDLLNLFEMILYSNGDVQWNFNYADYEDWDYDLYSGLYFGNTGSLLELYIDEIPEEESWLYTESAPVPEPATLLLISSGLFGLLGYRRKS